ncbi:hypothetical protein Bhyg_01191 [Pseudolycoriella hygida]|uniref:Uncharacterized protein n=1 Tax=Pseudolycoriella hygida TaxID=35572 RepID=A0A9Q0S5A5_9DIPT|nr:hypothetical protein Bhyg_01191 [Pseudolycoriella hygida]
MVFPNTMSGKPKIAPKTMPATNEMTVFDEEMGMDLHLVFSKTTTKPEVEVVEPAVESVEPAVKPVKPAVKPVEPTPRTTLSPSTKKPFYKFPKRQRKYKPTTKATTQSPKEDTKPKPKAVSSRFGVRPTIRVRNFNRSSSPVTLPRTKLSTTTPPAQDEEILQTSDDDSSHQSRFRLFSARYRLNYLRGNTTTATTLPPTPVETTTRQSLPRKHNRRPQRVEETSLSGRPSKINNNLTRVTDANHRSMMSKVRVALEAATAQNQITEIPRSFASVEMNNRVKKIEQAVVNKMINVIAETKSVRRRGDASKNNSRNNRPVTETPIDTHTSRPDRGKKKFELLDIFDETPVVPMSYSDFMLMRTRRTNAKLVDKVEEDGVPIPTTRRSRRRQTTTVRPIEANNETPNLRGRFRMRGRLTLTTLSPPVQTTTESTSISPATTPEITTLTPAQTTLPSTSVNKQQILLQEEASSKLQSESKNEQQNKDLDVEDIVTTVSPPVKENAETLSSEFKPSPLWSITIAEIMDSTDMEPNHAYVLDEQTFENTLRSRRSRNIFEPPAQYLNGFVPVTSLVGPVPLIRSIQKSSKAIVRYNLPMESKERISKN